MLKRIYNIYINELYTAKNKLKKKNNFSKIDFFFDFILRKFIGFFFGIKIKFLEKPGIFRKLFGTLRFLIYSILPIRFLNYLAPLPIFEEKKIIFKIYYNEYFLKVNKFNTLLDERYLLWKYDALDLILYSLKKYKKKLSRNIRFIEVGAASGIVSLFLKKILNKSKVYKDSQIYILEPSIRNINSVYENAKINNLEVNILPIAISNKNQFINFIELPTRGLTMNSYNHYKNNFKISKYKTSVLSLNSKVINDLDKKINVLYLDTFKNENYLIELIFKNFKYLEIIVVEFDYGINSKIKKILKKNKFSIVKKDKKNNYLIVNDRFLK